MRHIYKLTPVSLYDIRGVESWLEDMAKRGLALKWLRPTLSTFEREPGRPARYRIEPFRRTAADDIPQAMLDLYQDFGWDFVCDTPELLVFSTQSPDAPEPHSDPELQGALWRKLYRSKRRSFWLSALLSLVVAVCAGAGLFQNGTPVLNLLTTSVLWSFVVLAAMLYALPQSWADVQRLALIVQQLEEGVPLEHRAVYPRRRWSGAAYTAAAVVLLAVLVLSQWVLPFTGGDIRPLEELTAFPVLSLAEVEGEGFIPTHYTFDSYPSLDPDGQVRQKDYGNFCDLEHYLLCWNQWDVIQTGDIEPEDWRRMEIQWYDLPAPLASLSVPLARELLDSAMDLDQDIWWTENSGAVWTVEYIPDQTAGFLAFASRADGGFHIAAAAAGDKAVLVKYTGQRNLADFRREITAMVSAGPA